MPLVYRALAGAGWADAGRVDEVVLHDLDPVRVRAVTGVLGALADAAAGRAPRVLVEEDLSTAVRGTDFVFSAMRVGGLEGRVADERIPLAHGLVGQETTGAGGVTYALRTVPVAVRLAETVRREAPEAWVVNFTNPAGLVTQAMADAGGLGDRVVGICDSPAGLVKRVAAAGVDPARAEPDAVLVDAVHVDAVHVDYGGLNHLGWLRRLVVDGEDVLPRVLASDTALTGIEEGRLFGADRLRTLGAIPNEYLWYWYESGDAVRTARAAEHTRAEYVAEQQSAFYAEASGVEPAAALAAWERTRRDRESTYLAEGREASGAGERAEADLEGGGYDRMALELMAAIARDEPARLVLNVRNRATLSALAADDVVEVPCVVDGAGPHPLPVSPLDAHQLGLVQPVKAVEHMTIEAALSGSYELAVRALAAHPLVDSAAAARAVLDEHLAAVPATRAVLTSAGR